MIESHIVLAGADPFTVSVRVIAIDRGGSGIRIVRLLDRFRVVLQEANGNCGPTVEFSEDGIERSRFPLFIEGTECNGAISPGDTPFPLIPSGSDGPGVAVPCSPLFCSDNSACSNAEASVNRARSIIGERCGEVSAARSARDAYAAAAAAMFALATAMFGVMAGLFGIPLVGQALGLIAMIVAVVALGVAIGLSLRVWREQMNLERAERRLQDARRDFTAAVEAVNRSCCPGCVSVDLTQPEC